MAKSAKAPTKSEIFAAISKKTGLTRKQVSSVCEGMAEEIGKSIGKKGPGVFNVPGLLKIKVIDKPPVPAHKGINPFTKQEQMFKAKPARKVVKIRPLKALKDMAK
jgi:nucleoid DNA-binding protein